MKMAIKLLAMTLALFLLAMAEAQRCPSLYTKSSFYPDKVQGGQYGKLVIKLVAIDKLTQQVGLVLKVTLPDGMTYVSSKSKKDNGLVQHGADLYFENIPASFKTAKFQIKVSLYMVIPNLCSNLIFFSSCFSNMASLVWLTFIDACGPKKQVEISDRAPSTLHVDVATYLDNGNGDFSCYQNHAPIEVGKKA